MTKIFNMKNDIKTEDKEDKEIKWGGLLNEFLWTCAGVNKKVIRQCPTEYAKYAGIGGTILFTALMAMLSGGYALFTVFKHQYAAIIFGFFWGLLIFNLDRLIVNTMYSDGKVTISFKEFMCALPRIIIAIFLGVCISTPLELKIFESEINIAIESLKENKLEEYTMKERDLRAELIDLRNIESEKPLDLSGAGTIDTRSKQVYIDLQNSKSSLLNENEKMNEFVIQRNRITLATGLVSDSTQFNRLTNEIYRTRRRINQYKSEINRFEGILAGNDEGYSKALESAQLKKDREIRRIDSLINESSLKINEASTNYKTLLGKEFDGFQAKMLGFEEIKKNESTRIAAIFIMLLFIVIEIAPVFFKMMIASGSYDDLLVAEKHKVQAYSQKIISQTNDNINTSLELSTTKNQNKLNAELMANNILLEKLAIAQAEMIETAIEEWKEEEIKKIKSNPSNYIKSNIKS